MGGRPPATPAPADEVRRDHRGKFALQRGAHMCHREGRAQTAAEGREVSATQPGAGEVRPSATAERGEPSAVPASRGRQAPHGARITHLPLRPEPQTAKRLDRWQETPASIATGVSCQLHHRARRTQYIVREGVRGRKLVECTPSSVASRLLVELRWRWRRRIKRSAKGLLERHAAQGTAADGEAVPITALATTSRERLLVTRDRPPHPLAVQAAACARLPPVRIVSAVTCARRAQRHSGPSLERRRRPRSTALMLRPMPQESCGCQAAP
jgi:hypothetical protein